MTTDELRRAIAAAGMTQKETAEYCGVTLRTVQNWVSGRTPIPLLAERALHALEQSRQVDTSRPIQIGGKNL